MVAPLVTVITPARNSASYITETLDALCAQTLQSFEAFIVDDGSSDGTAEIVSAYAHRDCRIHLLKKRHSNAGDARNLGMTSARGDYLMFLDADDVPEPNLLERASLMLELSDADLCLFSGRTFFDHPWEDEYAPLEFLASYAPLGRVFSSSELGDSCFQIINAAPWTKMFRRSFVEDVGLRFQSLENANDMFFTYAALSEAARIIAFREGLIWYRKRRGSSQRSVKRQPLAFYEALGAVRRFLVERGSFARTANSLKRLCVSHTVHNLTMAWQNQDMNALRLIFSVLADEGQGGLQFINSETEAYFDALSRWESARYSMLARLSATPFSEDLDFAELLDPDRQ